MSSTRHSEGSSPTFRPALLRGGQAFFLALLLFAASSLPGSAEAAPAPDVQVPAADLPNPARIPLTGPIHFQARAVTFHVMEGVHFSARQVDALLLPSRPGQPVVLDSPESMKIRLLSADTSISAESLTHLLNGYTLPQAHLPLREVVVTFEDGNVHISGKLHKLIDLPFTAQASLTVTSTGSLRLHFDKITAAGIVHKGLLDMLGLHVEDFAHPAGDQSIRVRKDDVYFPLHALFPAPHFNGRLTSASIVGDDLLQVYGNPKPFAPAPMPAEHYVYFRGGVMQFGRLTMQGVDLELLNCVADESFELSLRDLFQQALPGYLKNLPDRGMVAYVQSFHDPEKNLPAEEKAAR